jgi:hypothetical protein
LKIVAAIHWEALRLWIKGARLAPRPDPGPENASNTGLASGQRYDYTAGALSARPAAKRCGLVKVGSEANRTT